MVTRRRTLVVHGVMAGVMALLVTGIVITALAIYRTPVAPRPAPSLAPVLAAAPAPATVVAEPVATTAPEPVATHQGPVLDPAWVARIAAETHISPVAIAAYGNATLVLTTEQPSCRIGWTTLAGIGYVESLNGTIGGRSVLADGRSSSPILGPSLDGSGQVSALRPDAAAAAITGDTEWDHAVGPLQFLFSTWQRWGADADGDGTADPFDIDDASLAAARYLCADGQDLTTGPGWSAAIFSYNHSATYVTSVYAAASAYARAS